VEPCGRFSTLDGLKTEKDPLSLTSYAVYVTIYISNPIIGLEWPRGFQEVKVPRFHDNDTGWW